jgi:hypothetical protein
MIKFEDKNEIWFFGDEYCENITVDERACIKVLTEESSASMWRKYVSEQHRHLMLVENDEWKLSEVRQLSYSWLNDWNNDIPDAFSNNLAKTLPWVLDDEVLFFWNRTSSVMAPWWLICKFWICFLYEDEMNIIINPKSEMAFMIGVNGYVATAKIA